jgi:hypothetical protein
MNMRLKHLLLVLSFLTSQPLSVFAQSHQAKYMGTGSCSSSNCHGSVHPMKRRDILGNEYYTWIKHDKHSQAYTNLQKAAGKRMASLMGLGDPTNEPLCLKCHSTYVPDTTMHGDKFDHEDGVSCESCHGAAEKWLESHAILGATHQQNLEKGLADTVSLSKRATLCVSCHFGDSDRSVTHDLYGAGHPRLTFELDTYGALEPRHWLVDQDYTTRKASYIPLTAWFAGQTKLAQGVLERLSSPERSKNGLFPELSVFDCYSCHHSLSEEQWKHRTYGGSPGRLNLNIAPLLILRAALGGIDPKIAEQMAPLVAALHQDYQKTGAVQSIAQLRSLTSDEIDRIASNLQVTPSMCESVFRSLVIFGSTVESPKFEVAEQIAMGLQASLASSQQLAERYGAALQKIFATLANSKTFDSGRFTKASLELASSLH